MQTITTLRGVQTFEGVSARGPWKKTVFSGDDGNEYATFKGDVASAAFALLNVPVTVDYTAKERNGYTDFQLNGVEPAELAPAQVVNVEHVGQGSKQTFIHRQSSLKAAIEVFGLIQQDPLQAIEELLQLADVFVDYVENGSDSALELVRERALA